MSAFSSFTDSASASSSSAASVASEIDASIWRAIAGCSVKIPSLNSYVYYFPQGHLEHTSIDSSSAVQNHNFTFTPPSILCKITFIRFLSSASSDQVFVKFLLQPIHPQSQLATLHSDDENLDDVVSFTKVLTPSDANNGGGFSVPKFCADLIFPLLNLADERPAQTLIVRDTHNNAWEFRHIYRGTPRRHLLTTGWSKFVNSKRLVAGDSVVFIRRKSTNELFIGLRRAARFNSAGARDCASGVFNTAAALLSIEKAERGSLFEVVYYPRAGMPDFVVSAKKVENALAIRWNPGMPVRIPADVDEAWRMTSTQGRIRSVNSLNSGPWSGSPWRMLQIYWDDPKILQNMRSMSPWDVEQAPSTSELDPAHLPSKKFKAFHNPGTLPEGDEGQVHFPRTEHPNSAAFHHSPFSSGVRRDNISISDSLIPHKPHQTFNEILNNNVKTQTYTVSTILNIGGSHSENLSPFSNGSVHFSGRGHNSSSEVVPNNSFQLFGKIIRTSVPTEK